MQTTTTSGAASNIITAAAILMADLERVIGLRTGFELPSIAILLVLLALMRARSDRKLIPSNIVVKMRNEKCVY
jgi:hypothetical protein